MSQYKVFFFLFYIFLDSSAKRNSKMRLLVPLRLSERNNSKTADFYQLSYCVAYFYWHVCMLSSFGYN